MPGNRGTGSVWYADTIGHAYPDELTVPEQYTEGARKLITVNAYERSAEARKACIRHHGTVCKGCEFDFGKTYGDLGKDFIHVHHIRPLTTIRESYKLGRQTLAMHAGMLGRMTNTPRLEILAMELLMACDKSEVMDALTKITDILNDPNFSEVSIA